MLAQVDFALESFATRTTGEWFHALMFSHMRNKIAGLAEILSTNSARMRFFACVNISVFFHVWFLVEALAAKRTRIRPRVAVDQKMSWKGWRTLELLVTNVAIVNLFFLDCAGSRRTCDHLKMRMRRRIAEICSSEEVLLHQLILVKKSLRKNVGENCSMLKLGRISVRHFFIVVFKNSRILRSGRIELFNGRSPDARTSRF